MSRVVVLRLRLYVDSYLFLSLEEEEEEDDKSC